MPRLIRKRTKKPGLPPGTVVYDGETRDRAVDVSVIDYSETVFEEKSVEDIESVFPYRDSSTVTWINVDGIRNLKVIQSLARKYHLHPLAIEDVLHVPQRPKAELYDGRLLLVAQLARLSEAGEVLVEQGVIHRKFLDWALKEQISLRASEFLPLVEGRYRLWSGPQFLKSIPRQPDRWRPEELVASVGSRRRHAVHLH